MTSVLQSWVAELPLRAQGTLLTGIRGCDLAPKNPLCNDPDDRGCSTGESTPERQLSAYLRWCCLNTPDPREIDVPGAWIQSTTPVFKPSQLGHYPMHWVSHIMHCYEVVGYTHPDEDVREAALRVYVRIVHGLHLRAERYDDMMERFTEDRFAKGEVVS